MSSVVQYLKHKDWHLRRVLALCAGLFLAYQALIHSEALTGVLSLIFLFQAITNTGCFGRAGCTIPYTDNSHKNDSLDLTNTEYEEVN